MPSPSRPLLLSLLCALLLQATPALGANPHLGRGIRLLDRAEDERALAALQQALRWKRSTPVEVTRIHLYLGITYANLIRKKDAQRHFQIAFERDLKLELPADLSPKTAELAEAIRSEVKARLEPEPPPVPPQPPPKVTPAPVPPVQPLPPRPARKRGLNWPAWSLGGLAVAAGATGLALALVASSEASSANDLQVPYRQAQAQHDGASTKALTANILFGVAGAAAIASTVLFIVGRERKPAATAATLAPIPGGALLQVRGVAW